MENNIDILKEFARRTNREIKWEEVELPKNSYTQRSIPKYRREISIRDSRNPNLFFILYGDFYKSRGDYSYHSGVYMPINNFFDERIIIRKKDFLDNLNPSLKKRTIKTGIKQFDNKYIIEGSGHSFADTYLKSLSIHEEIKSGLNIKEFCVFGLNDTDLTFEENFNEKSAFGIYNYTKWIMDEEIIEHWFKVMNRIYSLVR